MTALADVLLRCSLQGGLAAVVVWGVVRLFPRIPAATQAWLWRIVAIKFLIGLVLTVPYFTKAISFSVSSHVDPVPTVIGAAFTVGLLMAIVALVRDGLAVRRLKRNSVVGEFEEARLVAMRIGCRRVPEVRIKSDLDRPLLAGVMRPTIYLPCDLEESAREMVLAHELAHLRRRDLAWEWLFVVLDAVFFFHPLAWLVHREHRKAQETACDAMVLRACRTSTAVYGRMLLSLTIAGKRRDLALTANMAGTYAALHARIVRLHRGHARMTFATSLALGIVALAILPTWRLTPKPLEMPASPRAAAPLAGIAPASRIDSGATSRRAMSLKEGRP